MADLWLYSLELEATFDLAEADPIELDSYDPATIEARSLQDVSAMSSFALSALDLREAENTATLDSYAPSNLDAEGVNP